MTPQQPGQPLQGMQLGNGAEPMQAGQPPMPNEPPQVQDEYLGEPTQEETMENVINSALSQVNLAKKLKRRKWKDSDTPLLQVIGEKIAKGYEADEDSRIEWMKLNERWMKTALLKSEPKTYPWPKASNVKYPLLATAAMQFSARAYPALVPSDGKIVKTRFIPYDPNGQISERAGRIAKHMSYQILCKMPGWESDMDKLLMAMAISGICFKKTYHDPVCGYHRSDLVYAEDLVVNYWASCLEDAYRKTQILHYTDNEIMEKVLSDEEFLELEYVRSTEPDKYNLNTDRKIATGTVPSEEDESTPHKFIECHTYWDLDGDGYEEPYVIIVHYATKQVARIIARWDLDGVKRNSKGGIAKIEPIEYYTAFPFIPNPDGSIYALGFGLLLNPINESVDSLINILIDAGSISNLQSGFIGKSLRIKMGETMLKPGEWRAVNSRGDDLRKEIVPLPAKEPSVVLMSLAQMLLTSGNQLASIAEIFVGKMPGQNTPATTTQETVKQGMAVFTAIYKRVYKSLEEEFKKIFRLNRITDGILEQENKILQVNLTSTDYDDDTYIIPGGDPTGDSESTKAAKVQQVGSMLGLGTIDPMLFTVWALQVGEIPNYQQLLKKPAPPPPPDPTEIAKQKTEQIKQEGAQQKIQLDMAKGQQDLEIDRMKAIIDANRAQNEEAHQRTMQSLELQGKKMDSMMDIVSQVMKQKTEAAGAVQKLQHTEVANAQKLNHQEQQNKAKVAAKRSGKDASK